MTYEKIDYFCDGKYKTGDVVICNENYGEFIAGEKYIVATKGDFEVQHNIIWINNGFEFVLGDGEFCYAVTHHHFAKFIDGEKVMALCSELETAEW